MTAKRKGESLVFTNPGDALANGDVVLMSSTIGIAAETIAATASAGVGMVDIEGVHSVPAVSGAVIAVGEALVWDVSAGAFDDAAATPATGDLVGGVIAMEAKASGVASIDVKLVPGTGTVAS
jgi:predicted RecA/RadA family phage recombinase